jgi:hypothetical protein
MMFLLPMLIAVLIALLLTVVSAMHFAWAFGSHWPTQSESELARMVVGTNGITQMPPQILTGIVAVLIALAALWPLAWIGAVNLRLPSWIITSGMVVLTLIFLSRGIAGYLPIVTSTSAEEPFATLNRLYFSPLIIVVGLMFAALLMLHKWSAS